MSRYHRTSREAERWRAGCSDGRKTVFLVAALGPLSKLQGENTERHFSRYNTTGPDYGARGTRTTRGFRLMANRPFFTNLS